jgi:ABC-type nitrate/sulfonate/bicarbonate transport system substrate-binding protein
LKVELSHEVGWAALASKLTDQKLEAANVPALFPLLVALQRIPSFAPPPFQVLGLTSFAGLSVTLSTEIHALLQKKKGPLGTPLRIGVETPRGDAHLIVRAWKNAAGLGADDTVLVPIAVSQCLEFFREGYVQGFCAQEPYTSQAEQTGLGVTVARSHGFFPHHPRSGLTITQALTQTHPEACAGLRSVIQKACAFCAREENWPEVKKILKQAMPRFDMNALELKDQATRPGHFFFEHPSAPAGGIDQAGIDFLRKACLATDPTWREADIRTTISLVYRNSKPSEPVSVPTKRTIQAPVSIAG